MDADNNSTKLANAEFILQKSNNKYLTGQNGIYSETTDKNQATKYKTDTGGKITLVGIPNDTYKIYEVTTPSSDYNLSWQDGYDVTNNWKLCESVTIAEGVSQSRTYTNKKYGAIKINKTVKKSDTRQDQLNGAKFRVHLGENKFLGMDSNGNWKYDATWDSATIFETGSRNTVTSGTTTTNNKWVSAGEGYVTINRLDLNKSYSILEVETPRGYNIEKQDDFKKTYSYSQNGRNYTANKNNVHNWNTNTNTSSHQVRLTTPNTPQQIDFVNKRIVTIEGFVWQDGLIHNKVTSNVDNIYTASQNDALLSGIRVHLKNINTKNDIPGIGPVTTDTNGHYEFKDVDYYLKDLENAYIEFEYDNTQYVPVEYNVGNDITKNSKAKPLTIQEAELDDNQLTGVEGNHPGRAVTEIGSMKLVSYLNDDTYKISNINFGLIPKKQPEYIVSENLEYVKLKINDYTYTYKYGNEITNSPYAPTVNTQDDSKTFSSKIYPSDIIYSGTHVSDSKKLKVYVVYSINVENTETENTKFNYSEGKLYLTSLTNTFDAERYSLCNNENNGEKEDFALWSMDGNKAKYNLEDARSVFKDGIESGSNNSKTTYIQFKMTEKAMRKILDKQLREEDIQEAPNVTTATAYHEYIRTDRMWTHNTNKTTKGGKKYRTFNGVKGTYENFIDNNIKETCYVHKSRTKNKSTSSIYIRFDLGTPRTISGIVFEDTLTEKSKKQDGTDESDKPNLGDGILSGNENNRARGVMVELIYTNPQKTVATLFQLNKTTNAVTQKQAITTTDENGKYSFEGVVPGYYYIRFTYGDGTQKIMPADEAISATEYRSTIINTINNNNIIKNAMEAKTENIAQAQQTLVNDYSNVEAKELLEWYKYLGDVEYSTALDSLDDRNKFNNLQITSMGKIFNSEGVDITDSINKTNVNALTPMVGISIENDIGDETVGAENKHEFGKFNFGIISPNLTVTSAEKKITNVKLIGQVGTTLVSANPTDKNQNYLSALDEIQGGSSYAKIEIDPENIYGSNLETTYEVTVKNDSLKDYIENVEESNSEYGTYFKYGIITDTAQLKKVQINEVIDDLDQKYNIKSLPTKVTQTLTKSDTTIDGGEITITPDNKTTTIEDENGKRTVTELKIKGWEVLERNQTATISYTVTSLLSTENDDTKYDNGVKIVAISLEKLTTLKSNLGGEKLATLTITPTTGKNKSYIVPICVCSALLGLGIVVIWLKDKRNK